MNKFKDFWDKNKEKLVFTSDRKKFKNFNSILKAFKTYKTLTNNNQKQYFNQYQHTGKTPTEKTTPSTTKKTNSTPNQ